MGRLALRLGGGLSTGRSWGGGAVGPTERSRGGGRIQGGSSTVSAGQKSFFN